MLQGILHEEPSFWAFVMISVVIGGWTAWRTGKSVADGWAEALGIALAELPDFHF